MSGSGSSIQPPLVSPVSEWAIVIGDFGSAMPADTLDVDIAGRADERYIAPERTASYAADVFAVGATICDILMDIEMPSGGSKWLQLRSGSDKLKELLVTQFNASENLASLVTDMMSPDPKARPKITDVIARIPAEFAQGRISTPSSPRSKAAGVCKREQADDSAFGCSSPARSAGGQIDTTPPMLNLLPWDPQQVLSRSSAQQSHTEEEEEEEEDTPTVLNSGSDFNASLPLPPMPVAPDPLFLPSNPADSAEPALHL